MLGTKQSILSIVIATLLLCGAPALASASARTFYLYQAGAQMAEEAPTNTDPTGVQTLVIEAEDGSPYSARSATLASPLTIVREGAFHLHVSDREPIAVEPRTYTTWIRVSLVREDGVQASNADGSLYILDGGDRTFDHPGSELGDADGWTDFAFDASSTLPTHNACNAAGECLRAEAETIVIPAGFSLALEFGLRSALPCGEAGISCVYGQTFRSLAQTWVDAGDVAADLTPVDPDHPTPIFPLLNLTDAVERALRQQDGRAVGALMQGFASPDSTWRWASTSSDSRLDVRVG